MCEDTNLKGSGGCGRRDASKRITVLQPHSLLPPTKALTSGPSSSATLLLPPPSLTASSTAARLLTCPAPATGWSTTSLLRTNFFRWYTLWREPPLRVVYFLAKFGPFYLTAYNVELFPFLKHGAELHFVVCGLVIPNNGRVSQGNSLT